LLIVVAEARERERESGCVDWGKEKAHMKRLKAEGTTLYIHRKNMINRTGHSHSLFH